MVKRVNVGEAVSLLLTNTHVVVALCASVPMLLSRVIECRASCVCVCVCFGGFLVFSLFN